MPPDLSGQPLDDLKQWLAITTPGEDALLLRLLDTAWQLCLRFTGLDAAAWSDLDEALRHGIVRFAAHQYREREEGAAALPATIAALWRPHRTVRL
ncbi:head-tail connector protein [Qipengyuania mesophila]|uniref:head-tail connector protein n=1 Tax=Qipengyuania mesophila TaxID=2867246 RepID=UPI0035169FAD